MTTATATPGAIPAAQTTGRKRAIPRRMLMLSLPLAIALAGGGYYLTAGGSESTENASLRIARISVAPDLSGRVVSVDVTDNQTVKAGDALFQIDPEPYELALAQAQAALSSARLNVEQLKAAYALAAAQEKIAADDAAYLKSELDRQQALAGRGVASSSALDEARHAAARADEVLASTRQGVASALAALGGDANVAADDHPLVVAAQVALEKADYNLSLTTVHAPADGVVYQAASFKPGQFVGAGAGVFALVESGDSWVDANFKETQLTDMRPGQPVEIEFDLRPGQTYHGHVAAIGAGTGSEFSLLPAQNATGNWVKVTQRVPVRVALDDAAQLTGLPTGVSATVTVATGGDSLLSGLFARAQGIAPARQ